jgi:hypothetical protein
MTLEWWCLAIAVAIHNIQSAVANAHYYATGNRWRSLLVGRACRVPRRTLRLCWDGPFLRISFSGDMYAVLFGLIGEVMVIISVRATTDGSSVLIGRYRCDLLVHGRHGNHESMVLFPFKNRCEPIKSK